ncbi:MAG: matrixin family metalloprotease [Acidimicrobiales bacterium]
MNRLPARLGAAFVLVAALTTAAAGASAPGVETRIDAPTGASDVVQGVVTDSTSLLVDNQVFTDWTFAVDETIEGSADGVITVRTEGGLDGEGFIHVVSGQPHLEVGDRVQMWLEPAAGEDWYVPVGGTTAAVAITADGHIIVDSDDSTTNFVLEGFFWADFDTPVSYRVNPNTPDLAGTTEINPIQDGFQAWEDDSLSEVDFTYAGTTNITSRTFDGVNAVFWAPTNAGYLARTTSIFNANTMEMVEFDVQFNPDWEWVDGVASGRFDVQTVATHEAGHTLGLGHPPGSGAVMFATLASGKVKRSLSNGDIGGVRELYGLPSCEGIIATIAGNDGNNTINGTAGDDIIDGGDGNDTINGNGGNDIICGGDGNDTISGGSGNDRLHGDAGTDNLGGGGGSDFIEGNGGNDVLRGGPGNDDLWGLGGSDIVDGDGGNDVARGGSGDDTVRGGDGDDKLTGSSGDDVLEGGDGDDKLFGHEGDDTLEGEAGLDRLFGNENDDTLRGNGGDDTMKGHDGDDRLYGGGGADLLRGGLDQDLLVGSDGHDNLAGGGAADTINGDAGNDILNGNAGHDDLGGGAGNDTVNGGIGNDDLAGDGGSDTLDGGDHNDSCHGGSGVDSGQNCESNTSIP